MVLLVTVVLVIVVTVDPFESNAVVVASVYDVVITGSLSPTFVLTGSVVVVVVSKLPTTVVDNTVITGSPTDTMSVVTVVDVAVSLTVSVSPLLYV